MRWIYLLFSNFFSQDHFFTSSTWGDATRGLSHFYMKSSKIQSFERLHHHEVRTLGLKFRSRKEGLVRWEVDFIVLVFVLVSLWRLRLWDIECSPKHLRSFLSLRTLKRTFFNKGFLFIMFFDAFFKFEGWGRFAKSGITCRVLLKALESSRDIEIVRIFLMNTWEHCWACGCSRKHSWVKVFFPLCILMPSSNLCLQEFSRKQGLLWIQILKWW
jgi:hypothetical protein